MHSISETLKNVYLIHEYNKVYVRTLGKTAG